MTITPYFYIPEPFAIPESFVDKTSRVKEWVYNATEVFIQFCTDLHLENIKNICNKELASLHE
ncbi:MAG: hypothetical protein WBD50_06715 [Candidatus Rhabdochlamydia sp.]